MTGNLFTFGCSYTMYHWPTWSDYLRPAYNKVYNYGHAGAGNSYIFLHFMHAVTQNIITKEDTVVVQWSGLPREDKIFSNQTTLTTGGLIYNNPSYNKEYYSQYFTPYQKGLELISYIKAVRLICNNLGINYKMFNMFPQWVGEFLGEPYGYDTKLYQNAHSELNKNGILSKIENLNNNSDFIQISLEEFNLDNRKEPGYICKTSQAIIDNHPTPYIHFRYAKEILLKSIKENYSNTEIDKLANNAEQWDQEVTNQEHIQNLCTIKDKSLYQSFNSIWPHTLLGKSKHKPYIMDYPDKLI